MNLEASGHALSLLLASLPEQAQPDKPLLDRAKELDKHYIPTRYPNGFERGAPVDFYTQKEAREAEVRQESPVLRAARLSRWRYRRAETEGK